MSETLRVGIVSWWFNRGQATVARYLRSTLADLGHRTFVLARPTRATDDRPRFISDADVWRQSDVTPASGFDIPAQEYLEWARRHQLQTVFFDQNYQFDEIAQLRAAGIRTVGRFVWEQFSIGDVAAARDAFDEIYSLTRVERDRYHAMGIDSPRVRWGCHPELLREIVSGPDSEPDDVVRFFYPGGFLTIRKPTGAAVRAFSAAKGDGLRLTLKSQRPLMRSDLLPWAPLRRRLYRRLERGRALSPEHLDGRIDLLSSDMRQDEYQRLFSGCHVCLAPSRWEGLGLHLYEAAAFGMPIITSDAPPMNEWLRDQENGILVKSRRVAATASGIPVMEPEVGSLKRAIEQLYDRRTRDRLRAGMIETRAQLDWRHTVDGFAELLAS